MRQQEYPPDERHVRFGLYVAANGIDELRSIWSYADDAGFDYLWVDGKLANSGSANLHPILLAAAIATSTSRMHIGCRLNASDLDAEAMAACRTLQALSSGRLEICIRRGDTEFGDAGWKSGGQLDERGQIQLAHDRIVSLTEWDIRQAPSIIGQSLRRPVIWASGDKISVRLAAKHCDVWLCDPAANGNLDLLLKALDEDCRAFGRRPRDVRRGVQLPLGTESSMGQRIESMIRFGINELLVRVNDVAGARLVRKSLHSRLNWHN
jgi:alkanesulfonate monooxygenase SsuD/methylene tetrahydromethanopterin reductase-like flavin-dependent oxidoreductase (luciferase family)